MMFYSNKRDKIAMQPCLFCRFCLLFGNQIPRLAQIFVSFSSAAVHAAA